MPHLRLIFDSNGKERPFLLKGSRWTIGRDPRSDIVVPDPLVSRRHAVLWCEGDKLLIRDAGAKNPVEVDGRSALDALEIPVGARLQFGNTSAVLRGPGASSARFEATDSSQVSDVWVLPMGQEEGLDNDELETLGKVADALQPVRTVSDAAWLMVSLVRNLLRHEQIIVARIGSQDRVEVLASQKQAGPMRIPRQLLSNLRSSHRAASLCRRSSNEHAPSYELMMAAPWTRGDRVDGFLFVQRMLKQDEIEALLQTDDTIAGGALQGDGSASAAPGRSERDLHVLQVLTRLFDARLDALETIERLENDKISLQSHLRRLPSFLSVSPETQELRRRIENLAPLGDPVLVLGERGSGKNFLALHLHSGAYETRSGDETPPPFVSLHLSQEGLKRAEDKLFGLDDSGDSSRIAMAHGGTLCLRHVELLSESAQLRLIDELENGRVNSFGESVPLRVRLIATSTLGKLELAGRMHPHFLSRFQHEPLVTVPLRRRLDDIPLLSAHFLEEYAHRTSTTPARVSPRAMDRLRAYDWPENVKELEQVLETAAVLARGHVIYPKQLPPMFTQQKQAGSPVPSEIPTLKQIEAEHIKRVLELVGGNKSLACKALGIAYSTLHEKLKLM